MIDSVGILLLKSPIHNFVEMLGSFQRRPEGLLDNHT